MKGRLSKGYMRSLAITLCFVLAFVTSATVSAATMAIKENLRNACRRRAY